MTIDTLWRGFLPIFLLGVGGLFSGCAVVPKYQREALANPAMAPGGTVLENRALNKLHDTREGAAGGNGQRSGGGCGCGN